MRTFPLFIICGLLFTIFSLAAAKSKEPGQCLPIAWAVLIFFLIVYIRRSRARNIQRENEELFNEWLRMQLRDRYRE